MPGVLGSVCRDRQGAFVSAPTFIRNNAKESAVYMNSRVSPPSVRVGSELEIRHSMRELVRQGVLEGLGNRSFMVDTDADLMGLIGAAGLANGLSQPERQAMSEFGQGFGQFARVQARSPLAYRQCLCVGGRLPLCPIHGELLTASWKPFPSIFVLRGTEAQRWPRPSGSDRVAPVRQLPSAPPTQVV